MQGLYPACGPHRAGHTSEAGILTLCALHAWGLNTLSHVLIARQCLKKFWKGALGWQWPILRIHDFLRLLHKLHPISQSWADMMEEESPDMPLLFEDLLGLEPSLKEVDGDRRTATCTRSASGLHPN